MTTNEALIRKWCAQELLAARRMMVIPYRAGEDIGRAEGILIGAGISGRTQEQVLDIGSRLIWRAQMRYAKQIGFDW